MPRRAATGREPLGRASEGRYANCRANPDILLLGSTTRESSGCMAEMPQPAPNDRCTSLVILGADEGSPGRGRPGSIAANPALLIQWRRSALGPLQRSERNTFGVFRSQTGEKRETVRATPPLADQTMLRRQPASENRRQPCRATWSIASRVCSEYRADSGTATRTSDPNGATPNRR